MFPIAASNDNRSAEADTKGAYLDTLRPLSVSSTPTGLLEFQVEDRDD